MCQEYNQKIKVHTFLVEMYAKRESPTILLDVKTAVQQARHHYSTIVKILHREQKFQGLKESDQKIQPAQGKTKGVPNGQLVAQIA